MIRSEFSQFFVTHGLGVVRGPFDTRSGARASITNLRNMRDRMARLNRPLTATLQNVDAFEVTEARYALTGKTAHAAKAG